MEGRVFYRSCGNNQFKKIDITDLRPGDTFIIKDYPDGSGHGDGKTLYKATCSPYQNNDGVYTVMVEAIKTLHSNPVIIN